MRGNTHSRDSPNSWELGRTKLENKLQLRILEQFIGHASILGFTGQVLGLSCQGFKVYSLAAKAYVGLRY